MPSPGAKGAPIATMIASLPIPPGVQGDWYFVAEQPAPAPHLAHPERCATLRIVLVTLPRVSRSCEHSGVQRHPLAGEGGAHCHDDRQPANLARRSERLVFCRRTASASTAPCTFRSQSLPRPSGVRTVVRPSAGWLARTDLAPWEFEFPLPGSLTATFLEGRCKWSGCVREPDSPKS